MQLRCRTGSRRRKPANPGPGSSPCRPSRRSQPGAAGGRRRGKLLPRRACRPRPYGKRKSQV
ncbi:hypothetical protein FPH17_04215 [Corynebacterium godavarianum]|uniref:Uncharacterized protein n=2 Tax=Corynebacterium TaxID=1716 RepID=A0ABY3E706_9CORY|nr:hypothetical protein EAW56_02090 [Corynebacterium gottingense]TSJ75598.1 hypothetical protein FPH17_04215 [Corynebacterium godavarianum]